MATPPVTLSPFSRRPISYSESHIHLPRIQSNLRPLLAEPPSPPSAEVSTDPPSIPLPLQIEPANPTPIEPHDRQWIIWALRFNLHLALISLFETLFFWHFVSPSEDTALTDLVQSYMATTLQACAALSTQQRTDLRVLFDQIINVGAVDAAGIRAAATRSAFNGALLRNSWLYCGGISGVFLILSATAWHKKIPVAWRHIAAENMALIVLLACYEAMFFSTVAFRYQAVSMAELDRLVADQIQAGC
jgi:hypothetical protein